MLFSRRSRRRAAPAEHRRRGPHEIEADLYRLR
jgi:hypothetical protein